MPESGRIGRAAEDEAAEFLMAKGYTIVTRRFKARHGEIDIVALDGDLLVFVEVKATAWATGRPEDALDAGKLGHLRQAVEEYLVKVGEFGRTYRLDLVAVAPEGLRHYEDAARL